jgi:hypothetical protein
MSRFTEIKALLGVVHPVSGAWAVDDALAAVQMNLADVSRIKASLTGAEIWTATVASEYSALTDSKKSQWLSFCAIATHNPEAGGLAQLFVIDMFGGGTVTVTNLGTLRSETVSLAQANNLGRVRSGDITYARAN